MSVLDRFRNDIRLRNLTIPAQWFGVLSGGTFGIIGIYGLVVLIKELAFGDLTQKPGFKSFLNLTNLSCNISKTLFLPFGPFAIELPYMQARFPWLVRVYGIWFTFGLGFEAFKQAFASNILLVFVLFFSAFFGFVQACDFREYGNIAAIVNTHSIVTPASVIANSPIYRKVVFYVLYTLASFTGPGYPLIWDTFTEEYRKSATNISIPALLGSVAILLYLIARARGHGMVHSRVLGGSGVEPMTTTLNGVGRSPDFGISDDDEDDGRGRIRL